MRNDSLAHRLRYGREMTENECRCRLREAATGRLTLHDGHRSDALEVSYVAEDDQLLVASRDALTPTELTTTRIVDLDIDEFTASRWKIHITGHWEAVRTTRLPAALTNGAIVVQIEAMTGWHLDTECVTGAHD